MRDPESDQEISRTGDRMLTAIRFVTKSLRQPVPYNGHLATVP